MAWKYFPSENAILLLRILLVAALCQKVAPCLNSTEKKYFLNPSLNGPDIVQKVVLKLYSLEIVTCDRCLLRRIALVETEDGASIKSSGGIWALNESKFNMVKKEVDDLVSSELCVSVRGGTPYSFLNQPLVSGLAAALYLNYLKNNQTVNIPLPGNIEEQAQFWRTYYHTRNVTVDYFVEQVERFECKFALLFCVQSSAFRYFLQHKLQVKLT